jgi:hypothetical protein
MLVGHFEWRVGKLHSYYESVGVAARIAARKDE